MSNTYLLENIAQFGGAIYYLGDTEQLIIYNSQISNNKASKGGGIYFEKSSLCKTENLSIFLYENNNYSNIENDLLENPRSLTISLDGGLNLLRKSITTNTNDTYIEKIIIHPYKILGNSNL